jgi:dipeptidyl-peptidase 4
MPTTTLPGQLNRTRLFTSGVPDQFTVAENAGTVFFLRSRAGDDPVACLWALELDSGTERLLADPAGLSAASSASSAGSSAVSSSGSAPDPGAAITGYATDWAGSLVVFALSGRLWAVQAESGRILELPATQPVAHPRPDPTGRRIAYVCDGALRVIEADGTGDRAVATPDGPEVTFGVADYAAETPAAGPRGFWWSPDGERLLVKRVDSAAVQLWYIADPARPGQAPCAKRYPAAGTANAAVALWIVELDGSRMEARWDHGAFEYVPDAGWDAHGPYAVVKSRDQRTVQFLGIDPADGATRVLSEQSDACWVQPIAGLPARTGSGTLVAHADLHGTRHLTVDGALVTAAGLQLLDVLGIEGDEVLFTASEEPTERQLWSYRPGPGVRRLSDQPGVHTGVRRGGTLVHVARSPHFPGSRVTVLRNGDRTQDVEIANLAERPALDLRVTRLVLGPRALRAALYLPSWHRRGDARLPVLMDPYGGASVQRVTAQQDLGAFISQWFAEQGFAVLVADGSGTGGRGPDWEREVYGDIYTSVLDDQVAALYEAARLHPVLDLDRVGIRGWSYGGSLALAAVLRRPDVFHVAVAGAAVTDQRLYDAPWRERFLGHPAEFPERYEACSLLLDAPKLARPLLLIHGLADDNVFPVNTLRLSSALLAAGRPHEVLLLPGVGHRALGAPIAEDLLGHQLRFLKQHLPDQHPTR